MAINSTIFFEDDWKERWAGVQRSFDLSEQQMTVANGLVIRVAMGRSELSELPQDFVGALGIEDVQARELSIAVVAKMLMPLEAELDLPLREMVAEWGGNADTLGEAVGPESFVQAFVARAAKSADERIKHRLEGMLLHYVKEEISRDELIAQMQRSSKLNGLGVSLEIAQMLMDSVDKQMGGKRFVEEGESVAEQQSSKVAEGGVERQEVVESSPSTGSGTNEETAESGLSTGSSTNVNDSKEDDDSSSEDLDEVERIKGEKAHLLEAEVPKSVDALVRHICSHEAFSFEDEALGDRCRKIVESRVREVRTARQTQAKLESSVETGGLGLNGRALADVMQVIESKLVAFEGQMAVEAAKRKREAIKGSQQERVDAHASAVERDEQLLNDRHVSMTGKAATPIQPVSPARSRVSAAVSHEDEMAMRAKKIDAQRVKEVVEKVAQKRDQGSVVSDQKSKRIGTMMDVVPSKRLKGPVDELAGMDLIEFRRLSKDPRVAMGRITDKVDLLEHEGYDKYVAGIRAWQSSPLNQLYVRLTQRAVLEGLPMGQILEQERSAGGEAITDDELKVLMDLNHQLRF